MTSPGSVDSIFISGSVSLVTNRMNETHLHKLGRSLAAVEHLASLVAALDVAFDGQPTRRRRRRRRRRVRRNCSTKMIEAPLDPVHGTGRNWTPSPDAPLFSKSLSLSLCLSVFLARLLPSCLSRTGGFCLFKKKKKKIFFFPSVPSLPFFFR